MGWAGLAGGVCAHILNHDTILPRILQTGTNSLLSVWFLKVKLTNSGGEDFCGGVLIQDNFVLTTAKCSLLYRNISVKTSKYFIILFKKKIYLFIF